MGAVDLLPEIFRWKSNLLTAALTEFFVVCQPGKLTAGLQDFQGRLSESLVPAGKQCLGRIYLVALGQAAPLGLSNVCQVGGEIELLHDSVAGGGQVRLEPKNLAGANPKKVAMLRKLIDGAWDAQ